MSGDGRAKLSADDMLDARLKKTQTKEKQHLPTKEQLAESAERHGKKGNIVSANDDEDDEVN